MTQGQQVKVREKIWHGKMPYSPEPLKTKGLTFVAVDAISGVGPTVVLAAAYRFGSPFTTYYGGQFPRPIRVVAINEETGGVFEADLNEPDHPPVRVLISDQVAESTAGDGSVESAFFNIDLTALLRLPELSGHYKVFLWLDEFVSPVMTVNVPANPARGGGKPVPFNSAQMLNFAPDSSAPKVETGNTELALSGNSNDSIVYGSWLRVKADKPEQPVLWLLSVSHRDRTFGSLVVRDHDLSLEEAIANFKFKPQDLLKTSGIPQKIFVLSVANNGISKVHVVRAQ